jgi:3-hydroxyacyl-CoA dehydrogenase
MSTSVLIAGSGKVALDTGMHFLKQGNAVSWVSRSEARLIDFQGCVNGAVHAFMSQARGSLGRQRSVSASFFLYDELAQEKFDVIVECTTEAIADKKDVAARLAGHIDRTAIFVSTSLSIPPSDIHPACAAFRIRYPLELSKSADLVFPSAMADAQRKIFRDFFSGNGISCFG